MKNSNLDVWVIQHFPEEIETALSGVKDSETNMLFTNCVSYLRIGNDKIPVHFDTAFYSEESDRLILLMKKGKLTEEKFRRILENKKIGYNEVCFYKPIPTKDRESKELWFARDGYVLEDALKDSKKNGIDTCDFYPAVKGRLELRHSLGENKGVSAFDAQNIRGVVVLEDKIVLHIDGRQDSNISYKQALKILYDNDMNVSIHKTERDIPRESIPKQYKKEQ